MPSHSTKKPATSLIQGLQDVFPVGNRRCLGVQVMAVTARSKKIGCLVSRAVIREWTTNGLVTGACYLLIYQTCVSYGSADEVSGDPTRVVKGLPTTAPQPHSPNRIRPKARQEHLSHYHCGLSWLGMPPMGSAVTCANIPGPASPLVIGREAAGACTIFWQRVQESLADAWQGVLSALRLRGPGSWFT